MTAHRKGESENSMKKTKLLIPVLALGLLAGCAPSTTTEITPVTFAQQCELAGIEFTYVDPNAAISTPEVKPAAGEEDCVPATGTVETSYTAAKGGSYYTYKYMVERSGLKYATYYWTEATEETAEGESATTLAEAAALENAKYMTEVFPEDGKAYTISSYSNTIATKTFVSVGKDGGIQTAVYNTAATYDAATNTAAWQPGITSITGIGDAILESGKCNVVMYEYNPTSGDKVGPGNRNFGARMECELVLEKSTLTVTTGEGEDKTTETLTGSDIGEIGGKLPEGSSYFKPYLKVTAMYSLG